MDILHNPRMAVRNGIRAGAAAVALALLASGCTTDAQSGSEATTTTASIDYCMQNGNTDALQPFDGQKFFTQEDVLTVFDTSKAMYEAYPDAKPEEFANLYIQSRSEELGINNVQVVLDPSIGLSDWKSTEGEYANAGSLGQRTQLISDLSRIIDIVGDYPTGMLSRLNVRTIRLANTHIPKSVTGHYDTTHDEIQIEYNTEEVARLSDKLQEVIAHEIGHAIHDHWCGGHDTEDKELAGTIEFVGRLTDDMSDDEKITILGKVLNRQYSDGARRVFPNAYSATTVQEYFASIVEFTIEHRGLIQPGDKDYDSPLYYNQRLVISRVEELFPGFEEFVKKQTALLRTSPNNEIYDDIEHVSVTKDELERLVVGTDEQDSVVINGVYVEEHYSGRGGNISLYPKVYKDAQGVKVSLIEWGSSGSGMFIDVTRTDIKRMQQLFIFRMPGTTSLFVPEGAADKTYLAHGIQPRDEMWVGEPSAAAFVQQIQALGAKLIIIDLAP